MSCPCPSLHLQKTKKEQPPPVASGGEMRQPYLPTCLTIPNPSFFSTSTLAHPLLGSTLGWLANRRSPLYTPWATTNILPTFCLWTGRPPRLHGTGPRTLGHQALQHQFMGCAASSDLELLQQSRAGLTQIRYQGYKSDTKPCHRNPIQEILITSWILEVSCHSIVAGS